MSIDLLHRYAHDAGLTVPFVRQMTGWDEGLPEPIDLVCTIEKPAR